MNTVTRWAGDLLIILSFTSSLLFIVFYTVWYRWWEWIIGSLIALLDVGIALTLLPEVLHLVFRIRDNNPGWRIVAISGLTIVLVITNSRLVWLWRKRRHSFDTLTKRKKKYAESEKDSGATF